MDTNGLYVNWICTSYVTIKNQRTQCVICIRFSHLVFECCGAVLCLTGSLFFYLQAFQNPKRSSYGDTCPIPVKQEKGGSIMWKFGKRSKKKGGASQGIYQNWDVYSVHTYIQELSFVSFRKKIMRTQGSQSWVIGVLFFIWLCQIHFTNEVREILRVLCVRIPGGIYAI